MELGPTQDLHRELVADLPRRRSEYAQALQRANAELHAEKITFGGAREMATGLSALRLTVEDVAVLDSAARMVHGLVEKTLDWLEESPERMGRFFPHLKRVFPFLHPTRGWDRKQVVSRYDAVVTPEGDIKIIELNTCCPAGFLHSETFCRVTQEALVSLRFDGGIGSMSPGAIPPDALLDGLLEIERAAGVRPETIAALTDENQIFHELDLLAAAARRKTSRPFEIVDARQVELRDGQLLHNGRPISLAYNKFRISVPASRNHCWREGFEKRYAAYLRGVAEGALVSANNMYGMALAEDKGLCALWSEPELAGQFSPQEREFVDRHVAWTRPLAPSEVDWRGRSIRLPDFLLENRERFVVKPASEGRGFGVVIGKYASEEEWREACAPDPETPCVVQEFIEPVHLPVVVCRGGEVAMEEMFLTIGLATVCGEYRGLLSRVSPNPVTNVARMGMVQAVLVER